MHRAPVVGILVLDGHSVPLPEPLEVAHDLSKSPDMQGSHQLLVVSEEQFKVLPGWRQGPLGILGTSGALRSWAQMAAAGIHLKLYLQLMCARPLRHRKGEGWSLWAPGSAWGTLKPGLCPWEGQKAQTWK